MTEHFKYEDMTDEELIDQLREGDRQVMDYICDKYKNLVRSKAKSMYILGGDSEDLIQEGMLGLLAAIRGFQSGKETSFRTYAEICVRSRLYAAVRAAQRVLRTDAIPASPSAGAALHAAAQLIANGKSRSALAVFSARQNIL